jgi:integrase
MTRTTTVAPADDHGDRRPRPRRGPRKRSNGEGSIWQRKDGRFGYAAYLLTTGGTFKRVQGYARSHEDARKKLTELVSQSDQGIPVASVSWTMAEYLNYWLEHIVKAERRPKTYQGYEGVVRLHLIPGLGKKRLNKLNAQDVRIFITRVRNECQCCKHGWDAERAEPQCCALKGGQCCASMLSLRMIQSIHAVLRNALQCAVREEVIPRNVAKLVPVTVPKYKVNRGLTVADARRVLKVAADERLYALYVLALCLGLRRGELLGLRWSDIDLSNETLEVAVSLQRVAGALRLVPPKTDDSARTIPLPPPCVTALREHAERQAVERVNAGMDWQNRGLVFPSRIGTPMEPDNLRRSWARISKSAGIADVRFHDIRHTCVSLLLDLKVPPHIVREIVGHSDIEVTMTIYAHASLDEKRAALRKLGDALG